MIVRAACVVLVASGVILLGTAPALAAKEKFERTKPHVNIGTMGNVAPDEQIMTTLSLLGLGHAAGDIQLGRPCSAEFDIRYLDADDPIAPPLAEQLRVRLTENQSLQFGFVRGSTGTSGAILYVIVARSAVNVDGVNCVLRGATSVRHAADGRTTRLQAVRPEDFIPYDLSDKTAPPR